MKRGQMLGFSALFLTLATIVTLSAMGQPWVAGVVATTGLAVNVAVFVTGQYQPDSGRNLDIAPRQPVQLPDDKLPGRLPPPHAAFN